ncbi:hypothetical protein [Brevibacillus daliensis]|uniref:hypothetical protein n=1 Tax=Brevibacillus daliensis TaxID=2892995 RepID=UPI001E5BE498|nr:hypothetical protein [Brevibacillus daliensis]
MMRKSPRITWFFVAVCTGIILFGYQLYESSDFSFNKSTGTMVMHGENSSINESEEQVELFDSEKEKVISRFSNTKKFREEAARIIQSISGRVQEMSPAFDQSFIVKIPISPPMKLTLPKYELNEDIHYLYVVMPMKGKRKPWIIMHNQESETILMEIASDVTNLKKLLISKGRGID